MLHPVDPNAPRFFLDSSVILAGVASLVGASHALLVLGEVGFVRLVTLPYVFEEVERNLSKKLSRAVPRYQQIRLSIHWELVPNPPLEQVKRWSSVLPAKDAPVLAAAVSASPSRLVTLDTKHFIDSENVAQESGLVIVTPRLLVQDIRAALSRSF
jgi:predicted nucleic acid-binding protein